MEKAETALYCQAQGPTLGPTQGKGQGQGQGQDMVRSWSGHGQVRSNSNSNPTQKWDLRYTLKLVFTTTHTISK